MFYISIHNHATKLTCFKTDSIKALSMYNLVPREPLNIIVRQRVRGSTRFRNPRPVAMVSERSVDTIPAGRGFLNRVDQIGRAI